MTNKAREAIDATMEGKHSEHICKHCGFYLKSRRLCGEWELFCPMCDKILNVIRDALGAKALGLDSSMANTEEWDSLGHLSILAALDEFFEGKVAGINELVKVDSVKEIIRILKRNSLMIKKDL